MFLDLKPVAKRCDKWDRLYEALLNEDVHKLEITNELLKKCGFEFTIMQFVNMVFLNDVLQEIFDIFLDDTLQIALIPTNLERFMAKGKRSHRRRKN